ncbi:hypothetical protein [Reyranella sp.]|uniref:hypothetical protein n=1 Tax=Reyranella sp. TaxID=1929291 RepID=UPI003F71D98A
MAVSVPAVASPVETAPTPPPPEVSPAPPSKNDKRAIHLRRIYVLGRLTDIAAERKRNREELIALLTEMQTVTDPARRKIVRHRAAYIRQRTAVLTEERAAMASENKLLLSQIRGTSQPGPA